MGKGSSLTRPVPAFNGSAIDSTLAQMICDFFATIERVGTPTPYCWVGVGGEGYLYKDGQLRPFAGSPSGHQLWKEFTEEPIAFRIFVATDEDWLCLSELKDSSSQDVRTDGSAHITALVREDLAAAIPGARTELMTLTCAFAQSLRLPAVWADVPSPQLALFESWGFTSRYVSASWDIELAKFDPTLHVSVIERVNQQGLRLVSLADFSKTTSVSSALRAAHAFEVHHWPSVAFNCLPGIPAVLADSFSYFEEVCSNLASLHSSVLAFDGPVLVGASLVEDADINNPCKAGELRITAVRESYRGRGIAKAMKVVSCTQAKATSFKSLHTGTVNLASDPMYVINQKLGFTLRALTHDVFLALPPLEDA